MSMPTASNIRPPMPRPTSSPPRPQPQQPQQSRPTSHEEAAEEAARVAHRYYSQVTEIHTLREERDQWRAHALAHEKEIERLQRRESDLIDQMERQNDQLSEERDRYKNSLNALVGQFQTAGSIILSCMEAANTAAGPRANLKQIATEVEAELATKKSSHHHEPDVDDDIPQVVKAGPREP